MPLHVVTWNVNSLRSVLRRGFEEWLKKTAPDVVCLQEVRATVEQLRPLEGLFKSYRSFWNPATKPGYAGVAVLTRYEPVAVEIGLNGGPDEQGRALTLDFGDFRVGSFYAPNASPGTPKIDIKEDWLRRSQEHIAARSEKPFVVTGDLNVAHTVLDSQGIRYPRGMNGCTDIERQAFQDVMDRCVLYDPMRAQAGESFLSTWWAVPPEGRSMQNGFRYDYILLQEKYRALVERSTIHPEVGGSDHCPVSIVMNLSTDTLRMAAEAGQVNLL